ncbi:TonB-dependent receptor [Novosphingobium resinovorum]|uniref:TonB-dependent receptor plug domain-containing protein n=1 Tax=Novosphingobium TaxID=165696 RepID=UPI001B3C8CB5|nr:MULTISPECIES: TonB-dependent receptor [Novosphingobium]MBF7013660.1 TonB-dependent receptor [Novosphingobium sp. HR1a]WJM25809.1 TonB-dependent receptor [Novosphingobium resinovorum]
MSRKTALLATALLCCTSLVPTVSAWAQDTAQAAGTDAAPGDAIIVTGSRSTARKATESVSPIDVFTPAALESSGNNGLASSLTQISPAISQQQFGQDLGALVSSIRIHGLSPDQTLVLVNGKRRHNSGYLYASPGPIQGSAPADLDLIPMSAIDHIELLRDGASAQYGSDAIAGVINIILKDDTSGGSVEAMSGIYQHGDGFTAGGSANAGMPLLNGGHLNLSADLHYNDYTNRSGPDNRFGNAHVDKAFGAPQISRQSFGYDAAVPLGTAEIYSFGTYAHRIAKSFGFYRTLGGVGYSPNSKIDENDYSITGGIRGDGLAGFHWDLSSTYGRDHIAASMTDSGNASIYAETGSTPTSFYLGTYVSAEWTNNLDLTRQFDVGLAQPVSLALGGEFRRSYYTLGAGDPNSYYGSGASASPGLPPTSAGSHDRDVWAGYGEVDAHLTDAWEVDLAGRVEHYSDVGTNGSYKISTRYEISPALALRGTYNTAFRVPTLAQQYFSNLGVSPSAASGQLAVESEAARLLGAKSLKPEKSKNVNLGLVITPAPNLSITFDAYQIKIKNRIAAGGTYQGEQALEALAVGGYQIPDTVDPSAVSATYFANVADTRTRGVDFTVNWTQYIGDSSTIDWSLAGEINRNKVTNVQNDANGQTLLNTMQRGWLEHSQPADKVTFSARWKRGPFELYAQEVRYGPLQDYMYFVTGPNAWSGSVFNPFKQKTRYITSINASYKLTEKLKLTVGADNVFNSHPSRTPSDSNLYGVTVYDYNNPQFGINGGFVYGKLTATF